MFNKRVKTFIAIIVTIGISIIIYSLFHINIDKLIEILFFGILAAITESLPIYINKDVTVSVGYAVDLMGLFVLGFPNATIVAVIGVMFHMTIDENKNIRT
ncbi:MAG: diguanylate cyclase, partial [Thermoanaerobacterium sp.]|nr:diguanylate cyclase [Thermoanaerobacterium sp.]